MTDKDVIHKLHRFIGLGRVNGPYQPKNPKHSKYWTWAIFKCEEMKTLLPLIRPKMGERRKQQIDKILEYLTDVIPHEPKSFKLKNIETGKIVSGRNIKKFALKYNVTYRTICKVVQGTRKSHKQWVNVN